MGFSFASFRGQKNCFKKIISNITLKKKWHSIILLVRGLFKKYEPALLSKQH